MKAVYYFIISFLISTVSLKAVIISPTNPDVDITFFGQTLSLADDILISGSTGVNNSIGVAIVYTNLFSGSPTEYKIYATDGVDYDYFGSPVDLYGNTAIVGAQGYNQYTGAAYVYTNVDTGSPTEYKFTPSDGVSGDGFGVSGVAVFSNTVIAGAPSQNNNTGAAYIYTDIFSGSPTELKITASDAQEGDYFGAIVALSGTTAIVAKGATNNTAYVYNDIDTGSPTEYKLHPSDGSPEDGFGGWVGMSGNTAIVSSVGHNNNEGAAYLYFNVDNVDIESPIEKKLTPFDHPESASFGSAVGLDGTNAIISSIGAVGSVYIYTNVDTDNPIGYRLMASDLSVASMFGVSAAINGDTFAIGSPQSNANEGAIYLGKLSSISTLDDGNTDGTLEGISFVSQDDWVIGKTTDNNTITLSLNDTANITELGKAVYVGMQAGSDGNRLFIDGILTANEIVVGADMNTDNRLLINGAVAATNVRVASFSSIGGGGQLDGNLILEAGALWEFDATKTLSVYGDVTLDSSFGIHSLLGLDNTIDFGTYVLISGTATDFSLLGIQNWGIEHAFNLGNGKSAFFKQGSLEIEIVESPIPEPSTTALLILGVLGIGGYIIRRRR